MSPLAADTADSGPGDIFAAVQQQLGLRLEPKKASIEFLIVDSRRQNSHRELSLRFGFEL